MQGTRAGTRPSAREEIAASTVAVLAGGRSSEREISLVSARAILGALAARPAPGETPGPARCMEIAIEADGAWRVDGERCDPAAAIAMLPRETIYFIGLHGGEGENGGVQGFLETASRRYTGSGVGASALCMDKRAARLVARETGVAVADGTRIDAHEWSSGKDTALARAVSVSEDGWAVKPNAGGSSVATTMVDRAEDLAAAIETALATGDAALVEARIRGTEATCAVLGNAGLGNAAGDLRALTPVEIVPRAGAYFDWQQKYAADGAEELCPPRTIAAPVQERLRSLAARLHRAIGCDGYSRSDFIVPEGGSEPVFLEVNTLPGMTDRSLLPRSARAEGMSFRALCLEILGFAIERFPR